MRDAFLRHAGIDLFDSLPVGGRPDAETLARPARAGPACASRRTTRGRTSSAGSSARGSSPISASGGRPILHAYPASEAALARAHRRRSARRRTLRALLLRRRTRQRLRRTDRPGRAAAPVRGRHGRAAADLWRRPIRSTRISSPRSPRCPTRAARRSASTGWSCWRPGRNSVEDVQWTPVFDPGGGAHEPRTRRSMARPARRCDASSAFPPSAPGRRRSSPRCSLARTCSR